MRRQFLFTSVKIFGCKFPSLPRITKIWSRLTKLWQNKKVARFFEAQCRSLLEAQSEIYIRIAQYIPWYHRFKPVVVNFKFIFVWCPSVIRSGWPWCQTSLLQNIKTIRIDSDILSNLICVYGNQTENKTRNQYQSINQTNYFIVRLKVDQRAGQLSLPHLGITKTEK